MIDIPGCSERTNFKPVSVVISLHFAKQLERAARHINNQLQNTFKNR